MFCQYWDATKCYVYLLDVSRPRVNPAAKSNEDQVLIFRKSEQFRQGQTLQELIAPALVDFFCKEGELLCSKVSLEQHICKVTGILAKALLGSPLSDFSVAEQLLQAASRETFRKEDKAYLLLGMFGIYLPLIYSEEEENTFRRLKKKIQKSVTGEQTINRFIFSYLLISFCKKTSRTYPTLRLEAIYNTYRQQIPARTRSRLRT